MKKFVFKYEKILQLRQDKENEIKNELGRVNQSIQAKEDEIDHVNGEFQSFLNQINDAVKGGVYARDMQSVSNGKKHLTNKIAHLTEELTMLTRERVEIQEALIEANKQRKVMEKLKEKEWDQYKAYEALEDSKLVDQIVTYQSSKKQH